MKGKEIIEQIQNVKEYEELTYEKLEQFLYDKTFNTKPKTMIEQIKELRVQLDGLAQLTKGLKPIEDPTIIDERIGLTLNSKEIEKAIDSLLLAKAWLGKVLGELQKIEFKIEDDKEYTFVVCHGGGKEEQYTKFGQLLNDSERQLLEADWRKQTQTPYKNDGNRKDVKDIEPAADKVEAEQFMKLFTDSMLSYYNRKSHIEKVDFIREGIKKIIDTAPDFSELEETIELEQGFVYKYLSEARFWLGFELQRIKEE